jgi:hypothetical protein
MDVARQWRKRVIDVWRRTDSVVCARKSRGEKLREKTISTNDFAVDCDPDGPIASDVAMCFGDVLGTTTTKFAVVISLHILGHTPHPTQHPPPHRSTVGIVATSIGGRRGQQLDGQWRSMVET